jgi:hypothetical protein
MHITPERVEVERDWVRERAAVTVPLINETRERLGGEFAVAVDTVDEDVYLEAVDTVFASGDRAVNAAALIAILRDLDVTDDYPGFVVDELLGRELAATIAGDQPLRLLAEATFHYADVTTHGESDEPAGGNPTGGNAGAGVDDPAGGNAGAGVDDPAGGNAGAGVDDLDAALAAGFQTRLPGWPWQASESPFAVDP